MILDGINDFTTFLNVSLGITEGCLWTNSWKMKYSYQGSYGNNEPRRVQHVHQVHALRNMEMDESQSCCPQGLRVLSRTPYCRPQFDDKKLHIFLHVERGVLLSYSVKAAEPPLTACKSTDDPTDNRFYCSATTHVTHVRYTHITHTQRLIE